MMAATRITTILLLALLAPGPVTGAYADRIRNPLQRLPRNAAVYIDSMDGFGPELHKAFLKESVPLVIVSNKDDADFEITGAIGDFTETESGARNVSDREPAQPGEDPAPQSRLIMISIVNLRTKTAVWGYGVTTTGDLTSAAESCAQTVKHQIRHPHAGGAVQPNAMR